MDERDCIFYRIVRGRWDLPAKKVYECVDIIGLLDIQPSPRDQALVIPKKKHAVWFHKMNEELTSKIFIAANRISRKIKKIFDARYIEPVRLRDADTARSQEETGINPKLEGEVPPSCGLGTTRN